MQSLNSDELWSKLYQQTIRDEKDRKEWEEMLKATDELLAEARVVRNFREYYKRWLRTTKAGQSVKKQLLTAQNGRCFKCNSLLETIGEDGMRVDHSEIHHLAPLALLQRYAEANPAIELSKLQVFVVSAQYLRLVHPLCNKQLGEQIGNLPELKFLNDFLQGSK